MPRHSAPRNMTNRPPSPAPQFQSLLGPLMPDPVSVLASVRTCHLQNLQQTVFHARIPKSALHPTNKMLKTKPNQKKQPNPGLGL